MNVDAFAVQPAPAVPVAPGRAATPAAPIPAAVAASRFVPELAPIADKYHANLAALRAQAEEAMAWLKNAYLTQLSAADQGATAAGQIKIVAAILEERKSMQDGLTMSTVLPPDLPAALNGPRQTYIAGFRKLSADSALGRQRLDTDYLRDLGTLGARAPGGSEFAKQVEEEKALLVRNAPTAVVAAVEAAPPQSGSNRVVNGNFGDAAPDGFPKGWLFTNTAWIDPRTFDRKFTPSGLNIRAVQDGGETFVRCSYAMERGYIGQMVEIPPHKKEIVFKFHVRGKQPGKPDSMEAGFRFFSKDHKFIPEPQNLYPVRKTSPNAWHPFEFVCKLPVQAEYACIVMGSGDLMEGVYEFQRVEVGFR